MGSTKAIIKANGMEVRVIHEGKMSYYVTVDGTAIECCGNLSQAVASANRTAMLGQDELELRKAYAKGV